MKNKINMQDKKDAGPKKGSFVQILFLSVCLIGLILIFLTDGNLTGYTVYDNFNERNQTEWIVRDGGDNSSYLFQNDRYELHTESGDGSAKSLASYVNSSFTDSLVQSRIQKINSTDNFLSYILLRVNPATMSGYACGGSSSGAHLWFGKLTNGVYSSITFSGTVPFFNSSDFNLKCAVIGNKLFAKVWNSSTTEPVNWQIRATDSSYLSGVNGVMLATYPDFNWNDVSVAFDDFEVIDQSGWIVRDGGDNSSYLFQNDRYELHTESSDGSEKSLGSYVNTSFTDSLVQTRVQKINPTDDFLSYILLRVTPATMSGYACGTSSGGTHVWFGKLTFGSYSSIGSSGTMPSYDSSDFNLKCAVIGNKLFAKVWNSSTTEPIGWQINTTDNSYSSGVNGIMLATYPLLNWDNVSVAFDDFNVTNLSKSKVYVDDDWVGNAINTEVESGKIFGYNAFATIQEGINSVTEGAIINIAEGEYVGAVVNKTVILQGSGESTIITSGVDTGWSRFTGFYLSSTFGNEVEIKNLKIQCGGLDNNFMFGIFSRGSSNVTADSLIIDNCTQGISPSGGNGWRIINNRITNTWSNSGGGGLAIAITAYTFINDERSTANRHLIENNTIITNDGGQATFSTSSIFLGIDKRFGTSFTPELTENIIRGNTLIFSNSESNNTGGIEIGVVGSDSSNYESDLLNLYNNLIENNSITGPTIGLYLYTLSDMVVERNQIINSTNIGVSVWGCSHNLSFLNNNIYSNENYNLYNSNEENCYGHINATHNYWGSALDYVVNLSIIGNVTYHPYYIDEEMTQLATRGDGEEGNITLNPEQPYAVIKNSTQEVTITIENETDEPMIDFSYILNNGTVETPNITIISSIAVIKIPATNITSENSSWDGVLSAPKVTTITLPSVSGETRTLSTAIEIGLSDTKLSFDRAVRILFPNEKNKRVGYSRIGTSFVEITLVCGEDSQTWTDTNLAADQDCKMNVGNDLVVWTKHFTTFATYSTSTSSSSSRLCTTAWECSEWSECIEGLQIRQCSYPQNFCEPTYEKPIESRTCEIQTYEEQEVLPSEDLPLEEVPFELFDIMLTLEDSVLEKSNNLVAVVSFVSFGNVPTSVDLTYTVLDSSGNQVYYDKDEITVQTEEVIRKSFDTLNLPSGSYTLVLTTIYGDNVEDEFRQEFVVGRTGYSQDVKDNLILFITFGVVVIILFSFILLLKQKKNKPKKRRH